MSQTVDSPLQLRSSLPPAAYQFSLRRLLLLLAVASGIAAATVQWGPLVGWAVSAWAIAIALAIWSVRYRRWLALGVAIGLVPVGVVPGWLAANAPFRDSHYCCRYCGAQQQVSQRWLQPNRVTTTESEASRWANRVGLPERQHSFVVSSSNSRDEWFGYSLWACGGRDPVGEFFLARNYVGEEIGAARLREYQSLLDQNRPAQAERVSELTAADVESARTVQLNRHP